MADYYQTCAIPKPVPRKTLKRKARVVYADHVAEVRAFVFGRERGLCRCCRFREAASMHELRPKSLRGKVCKTNSIAVCGSGVSGCHGFLQTYRITWNADPVLRA